MVESPARAAGGRGTASATAGRTPAKKRPPAAEKRKRDRVKGMRGVDDSNRERLGYARNERRQLPSGADFQRARTPRGRQLPNGANFPRTATSAQPSTGIRCGG